MGPARALPALIGWQRAPGAFGRSCTHPTWAWRRHVRPFRRRPRGPGLRVAGGRRGVSGGDAGGWAGRTPAGGRGGCRGPHLRPGPAVAGRVRAEGSGGRARPPRESPLTPVGAAAFLWDPRSLARPSRALVSGPLPGETQSEPPKLSTSIPPAGPSAPSRRSGLGGRVGCRGDAVVARVTAAGAPPVPPAGRGTVSAASRTSPPSRRAAERWAPAGGAVLSESRPVCLCFQEDGLDHHGR